MSLSSIVLEKWGNTCENNNYTTKFTNFNSPIILLGQAIQNVITSCMYAQIKKWWLLVNIKFF